MIALGKVLLAVVALLVLSAPSIFVLGIYDDQLGEYDWRREHVGLVEKSAVVRGELLVASAEGVLACLDQASGDIKWRVVLPPGTRVERFLEAAGQLVTLSSLPPREDEEGEGEGALTSLAVHCWAVSNGALLWDMVLGADMGYRASVHPSQARILDAVYSSEQGRLTVLFGNALHFLAMGPAPTAVSHWSWSASADHAEGGGRMLVLSSLLVSTAFVQSEGGAGQAGTRVAVGCFVDSSSKGKGKGGGTLCSGSVVVARVPGELEGQWVRGEVQLDYFSSLPSAHGLSPSDLVGAVSSQAQLGYLPYDVIFGSSSGAAMTVLALSSNSSRTVKAPQDEQVASVSSFVYVTADMELRPALSLCGASTCRSLALSLPAPGGDKDRDSRGEPAWVLGPLEGGAADCQGEGGGEGEVSVLLQRESFRLHEGTAVGLHCLSLRASRSHLLGLAVGSIVSTAAKKDSAQHSADLRSLGLQLPPFALPPASRLPPSPSAADPSKSAAAGTVHHIAVLSRAPSDASQCESVRVLLVLHSGLTAVLALPCASAPSSPSSASLLWSRTEALAGVRQAVVVENPGNASASAPALDAPGLAPSFAQRMQLQQLKFVGYAASAGVAASSAVQVVTEAVQRLSGGRAKGASRRKLSVRKEGALRAFGFAKLAVCLTHSADSEGALSGSTRFSAMGLQLLGVDLLRGTVGWTAFPALPQGSGDPQVAFLKLVAGPAPVRHIAGTQAADAADAAPTTSAATVTLVLGTADGRTFLWELLPSTGRPVVGQGSCASDADVCAAEQEQEQLVLPIAQIGAGAVSVFSSLVSLSPNAAPVPVYSILHTPTAQQALLTHFYHAPAVSDDTQQQQAQYAHHLDRASGRFTVYRTDIEISPEACKHIASASGGLQLRCVSARAVASARFDPAQERVLRVDYPSALDAVHSRFCVLGDDSVLVKYLNPHLALVTSMATPTTPTGVEGEEGNTLYWTLLDTVSGKVVVRQQQENAALPVRSLLLENHLLGTYWNAKAKRTELSSTALYEGVIDSYELSPFASSRQRSGSTYLAQARAATAEGTGHARSAYSLISPIAMQKTFTLPHAVTALQHTVTAQGIAHKHVLLGLRNGQVFSVDMRQIHPRRPFSEPSPAEKTEGLQRYSPFLALNPLAAVTHNYSLPRGVSHIISAPSRLESSSVVFSFGGGAVDLHVNRVMPSQDFDMLASDFHYSLLVAILLALASVVLVLQRMQQRQALSSAWA